MSNPTDSDPAAVARRVKAGERWYCKGCGATGDAPEVMLLLADAVIRLQRKADMLTELFDGGWLDEIRHDQNCATVQRSGDDPICTCGLIDFKARVVAAAPAPKVADTATTEEKA